MKSLENSRENLANLANSDSENMENDDDRADSGLTSDGTIHEDENQSNGNEDGKPSDGNDKNSLYAAYKILVKIKRGIVVIVEREVSKKPFLGGYRNKVTGCEFHHASAQTNNVQLTSSKGMKITRDVQTKPMVSRGQQTSLDKSSQVSIGPNGLYFSQATDRILEAKPYVTTEELLANLTRNIIVIQKHWRGHLARERVKKLREESRKVSQKPSLCASTLRKKDFEDFQHRVQRWRQERMAWIFKTKSGPERLSALRGIIEQEAELLAGLNDRKMTQNREESLSDNAVSKISPSLTWSGQSEKCTRKVTPAILRIRKYRGIYHRLRITQAANSVRLKVLQELQQSLENQECELTNEIVTLAHQESVLIARDTPPYSLEPLRQRILLLFLQFIFDPKFHATPTTTSNPEQRGKTAPPPRTVSYCGGCGHYSPAADFVWSAGEKTLGLCWSCRRMEERRATRLLRRSGFRHRGTSYFLLSPFKGQHTEQLVQNIWHEHSVLSGVDDPYNLSLCRWKPEQPWSPWNCVLLTEEEAKSHHRLESPEDAYGPIFAQKVKHKHMMARRYFFRQLPQKGKVPEKDPKEPVSTSIYITVKPAKTQ